MTPADPFDSVPEDRSVIVVSDLHLGLDKQESVPKDFLDFLGFLGTLAPKGSGTPVTVDMEGRPRPLYAPATIILLGDIVDMWSPKDEKFSSCMEKFTKIIFCFLRLPPHMVYVAGNHDNEVAEFAGDYPRGIPPPHVRIIADHYPEQYDIAKGRDGKEVKTYPGLTVGTEQYFFLHGQQFDQLFCLAGPFQDYPGWVQKNYFLFKEYPMIKMGFRALFLIALAYAVAASAFRSLPFGSVACFIAGFTFLVCLFTLEPTTIRTTWDFISGRVKARTETIQAVIEEGFWDRDAGKNIRAGTVVFGHTHVVDDSKDRYRAEHGKRFINTGAWGHTGKIKTPGGRVTETNTFAYIDADGPLLFHWPSGGTKPVYIARTLTGDAPLRAQAVPGMRARFRRWLHKHFWVRA